MCVCMFFYVYEYVFVCECMRKNNMLNLKICTVTECSYPTAPVLSCAHLSLTIASKLSC